MVAAPFLAANGAVYSDGKVKNELRDLLHQAAKEDATEFAVRQVGTVTVPEVVRLDEEVRCCTSDGCVRARCIMSACLVWAVLADARHDVGRRMSRLATRPMLLRASAPPPTRCGVIAGPGCMHCVLAQLSLSRTQLGIQCTCF